MKLTRFRVRKFRNIIDSGDVAVESDVSCLVGMNEAGKTAVLAALNRLNPTDRSVFSVMEDYPRWLLTRDRRDGLIDDTRPIEATFACTTMEVSVLIDGGTEGAQRLQRAIEAGRLNQQRLIEISKVTGSANSDIEDVFEPEDYLAIYNEAFKRKATVASLAAGDRIVKRIERKLGSSYDHYKPAETLLRHQATLLPQLSEATLGRFAALFERINASRT